MSINFASKLKKLKIGSGLTNIKGQLLAIMSSGFLFTLLFSPTIAQAQFSIPDLYMVPQVFLTNSGAAVVQPQTGDGYDFVTQQNLLNTNTLESGTSYRPPRYDAFADGSENMEVAVPEPVISSAQNVDFSIRNNMPGALDFSAGTTNTTFYFIGSVITNNSLTAKSGDFEYRWDFNNDGKDITYFSVMPTVYHQFKNPGVYNVKLEVLDNSGKISQVIKTVTIAKNDPPTAVFGVDKISAPINSIFTFNSSLSSDSQYRLNGLFFRFDWDSDGQWDTNFQSKTTWNHIYREVGRYRVTMEAMDPEKASAKSYLEIDVVKDNKPNASMAISKSGTTGFGSLVYNFDASASTDDHTSLNHLKFRWDFNYTGKNDIVFDSSWSNSPKYNNSYHLGGSKVVRLQVMDEQSQFSETFAKIEVPWPQAVVERVVDAVM